MITKSHDFRSMGTDVSIEINSADSTDIEHIEHVLIDAGNIFKLNEKKFSRFDAESELTKINQNIGKVIPVSNQMFAVLKLTLDYYKFSQGFFDPRIINFLCQIGYDTDFAKKCLNIRAESNFDFETFNVPLEKDLVLDPKYKTVIAKHPIDIAGLVKGYTVDQVAKFLAQQGFQNFVVDAGGDMFTSTPNSDNLSWAIDVEGYDENFFLRLANMGIATSGITRKNWKNGKKFYHHLVNPKKPSFFSDKIQSVTVIAKTTTEADVYAKIIFLMGIKEGKKFAEKNNIAALFY